MKDETSTGFRLLDFDDEASGLLAYALDEGTLLEQDAAPLWQRFEDAAAKGAKIRIYAEYHGTPKVSGGLVLAKLQSLGSILATMERMALVEKRLLDYAQQFSKAESNDERRQNLIDAIAEIKELRREHTLGDLSLQELIEAGRR